MILGLLLLLLLVHLVPRFLVDALIKNLVKHLLIAPVHPLLLDGLLVFLPMRPFLRCHFFTLFDLRVALLLHRVYLVVELKLFVLLVVLLRVLLVHLAHFVVGNKVTSCDLLWRSVDLTLFVVVVNQNLVFGWVCLIDHENCLPDLLFSWFTWI